MFFYKDGSHVYGHPSLKCSGSEYFPYTTKTNVRENVWSTSLQRQTTPYVTETAPTVHNEHTTPRVQAPQNKGLMVVLVVIISVLLLVIIILTFYIIKRQSNERNNRNQTTNLNESHSPITGSQATVPVYVNVTNQSNEPIGQYESVDMRLISRPNPEVDLYTHLTPNEDRDTYLEPINTNRDSIESELNEPYEIID